jgi:hypothetical protein
MGREHEYDYLYRGDSTGTCYCAAPETADPNALGSRMRSYVMVYAAGPAQPDLAAQMVQDQGFVQQVEAGWDDLEQGRVSSLEDVKRRLGGV